MYLYLYYYVFILKKIILKVKLKKSYQLLSLLHIVCNLNIHLIEIYYSIEETYDPLNAV